MSHRLSLWLKVRFHHHFSIWQVRRKSKSVVNAFGNHWRYFKSNLLVINRYLENDSWLVFIDTETRIELTNYNEGRLEKNVVFFPVRRRRYNGRAKRRRVRFYGNSVKESRVARTRQVQEVPSRMSSLQKRPQTNKKKQKKRKEMVRLCEITYSVGRLLSALKRL